MTAKKKPKGLDSVGPPDHRIYRRNGYRQVRLVPCLWKDAELESHL